MFNWRYFKNKLIWRLHWISLYLTLTYNKKNKKYDESKNQKENENMEENKIYSNTNINSKKIWKITKVVMFQSSIILKGL